MQRTKSTFIIIVAFILFSFFIYQISLPKNLSYAFKENGILKIQDFFYHLVVVDAFWSNKISSIYNFQSQRQALIAFFGHGDYALTPMPIGVTPTALLIWYPFLLLLKKSPLLAVAMWMSVSCFLFLVSYWQMLRAMVRPRKSFLFLSLLVFVVLLSSYALRLAVDLGQTSIIASGAFILLLVEIKKAGRRGDTARWWLCAPLFFLLSLKITYLAMGALLLVIYRDFKNLLVGMSLVLFAILILQFAFDAELLRNYLNQLLVYSKSAVALDYSKGSLTLDVQSTFRGAFSQILPESVSLVISQVICGALGVFVLLSNLLPKKMSPALSKLRITDVQSLTVISFAIFMLFFWYWGQYEEVLLVVPISYALLFASTKLESISWLVPALLCAVVVLNQNVALSYVPLWSLWMVKVLLFAALTKALTSDRCAN